MVESKYTATDLKIMQSWILERKIQVSQTRLLETYNRYNNMCYVSFSGGKDSSVLADLTARVCKVLNCKLVLWFSDTGLEFPEVKKHVKEFPTYLRNRYGIEVELIVDYPRDKSGKRISFRDVVLTEGYPVISKTVSRQVRDVKKLGKNCWAYGCFNGREKGIYNMLQWKYLIDAPFKVSNKCCQIMKKNPAKRFNKSSGRIPIIGTMACGYIMAVMLSIKGNLAANRLAFGQKMMFWNIYTVLMYHIHQFMEKYVLMRMANIIVQDIVERDVYFALLGVIWKRILIDSRDY